MLLYVSSLTLLLLCVVSCQEPERARQGNQQSQDVTGEGAPKECTNFRLSIGKYTNYFYTCCGELKVDNPPSATEEMVANWDCNPQRIGWATFNETERYNCNSEIGQKKAREMCNARWGWIAAEDCWAWTACFAGVCMKEETDPGYLSEGFCGDGRCDSTESTDSCPSDCCPQKNPVECLMRNSTCTPACCSETACCASSSAEFFNTFWIIVFSVIGGVFLLINFCCCCCCWCCFKRCKNVQRKEKHPPRVDRQDTTMTVLSM
ncbi:uncharacterized protein [Asterias amurensis]|uniref:uncharacterized protein n=1 Tax=Asterias amurensis TaxID=7602 RepID=UPI003AB5F772